MNMDIYQQRFSFGSSSDLRNDKRYIGIFILNCDNEYISFYNYFFIEKEKKSDLVLIVENLGKKLKG